MKDTFHWLISRLGRAKERISELQARSIKIPKHTCKEKKGMQGKQTTNSRTEHSRTVGYFFKNCNIGVIIIPEERKS